MCFKQGKRGFDRCFFWIVRNDLKKVVEIVSQVLIWVYFVSDTTYSTSLVDLFPQVQAMKQGLMTVVPEQALSLLTWRNLEHGVCGDRDISLAHLKGACKWKVGLFCPETSISYYWLLRWSWLQCKLPYLANVFEMLAESVSFKRQSFHLPALSKKFSS